MYCRNRVWHYGKRDSRNVQVEVDGTIIVPPTHIAVIHLDAPITAPAHGKPHRPTPDRPFATFRSPLKLTHLLSRWTFTTTHCSHRKGLAVIKYFWFGIPNNRGVKNISGLSWRQQGRYRRFWALVGSDNRSPLSLR